MDETKLAEAVDALAKLGIDVDTDDLKLEDANTFLERLIGACRKAAHAEEEFEGPEASEVVRMSLGGEPVCVPAAQVVKDFEEMLHPKKPGLTTTPLFGPNKPGW